MALSSHPVVARLGALAFVFALGLPGMPGAFAADDGETILQAKDTISAIANAQKAKDVDALENAYVRLVELHNGLEGDSWRQKLQAAVGKVINDPKCPALHSASMTAFEQLDDGDGVYKQLKKFLPKPKDATVSDLQVYGIKIVGQLKSPAAVKRLLELATRSAHTASRRAAIDGLSHYRGVRKQRVRVFRGLIELLAAVHPAEDPPEDEVEARQAKATWQALEAPLVAALDELTYLDLQTSGAWLTWYGENKSKLKNVFKDAEADDDE